MSMSIAVALLVCIVGALVALISKDGDRKRLGGYAFWVGLFWVLYAVNGHVWRFGP
jgi:hypothetical protein